MAAENVWRLIMNIAHFAKHLIIVGAVDWAEIVVSMVTARVMVIVIMILGGGGDIIFFSITLLAIVKVGRC